MKLSAREKPPVRAKRRHGLRWIDIMFDKNVKETKRVLALTFYNDRVAFLFNISLVIRTYFKVHSIACANKHEYTRFNCATNMHKSMAEMSRRKFAATIESDESDDESDDYGERQLHAFAAKLKK